MSRTRLGPADESARRYVAPPGRSGGGQEDPQRRLEESEAQARKTAFAAGYEEGKHRADEEAAERARELAASIAAVGVLRSNLIREAEQDMLQLAGRIAEVIVRERVAVDSQVAVRALQAALAEIPVMEPFTVRCHPSEQEALQERLAAVAGAGHTIRVDPSISPGGCIVESAAGEIDVRVETQLRVIEHELLARS